MALLFFGLRVLGTSHRAIVSPDGRWEARVLNDDGVDQQIRLAPRGLVTWDPRSYPSREIVDFESTTYPLRVRWLGPRRLRVRFGHSSDGDAEITQAPPITIETEG